jgi:hypothetical protein
MKETLYTAYILMAVVLFAGFETLYGFHTEAKEKEVHCNLIKAKIAKEYNTNSPDDEEMRTFLMIGCY